MESSYYNLGSTENSRFIKIIQIIFGIICLAVSVYWTLFNMRSAKIDKTIWITVIFLIGFGFYQIWSGAGKAVRFIEIGKSAIRLKKTILLPENDIPAETIAKIFIFPFNLKISLKTGKQINLRLSSSYYETNNKIVEGIMEFAESNIIDVEIIEEKI